MINDSSRHLRPISSLALLFLLEACGGGGGGITTPATTNSNQGSTSAGSSSSSTSSGSITVPSGTWYISDAGPGVFGSPTLAVPGTPMAFPTATGSTPNFGSNLPPAGTVFPLEQTALTIAPSANEVVVSGLNSGAQLIYSGTQTINGMSTSAFELVSKDYSLDAKGLTPNNGSVTLADGRVVQFAGLNLNYSLYGFWSVTPIVAGSSSVEIGTGISGYQTPSSAVPSAGSATYIGNGAAGGVQGTVFSSSGPTLYIGALSGQASIAVNFASSSVTGSLTGMTATSPSGTSSAWNDVALTGSLSGSTIAGTTSTPATVVTTFGLSTSSYGTIRGALFGPNGQELGLVWTLVDPSTPSQRSAYGFVGATKQ